MHGLLCPLLACLLAFAIYCLSMGLLVLHCCYIVIENGCNVGCVIECLTDAGV
jgi:hypothetical protein